MVCTRSTNVMFYWFWMFFYLFKAYPLNYWWLFVRHTTWVGRFPRFSIHEQGWCCSELGRQRHSFLGSIECLFLIDLGWLFSDGRRDVLRVDIYLVIRDGRQMGGACTRATNILFLADVLSLFMVYNYCRMFTRMRLGWVFSMFFPTSKAHAALMLLHCCSR